jgi:ParB-like chromosome segregation protein Spo0J
MTDKREWRIDPDAETILRDIAKLPFCVDEISLGSIDWVASANNCARLRDPLNAEKIEDYLACFRRGDVFPMIVVERHKKSGKYIILGGNQRMAALKQIDSGAAVSAYVVDPLTGDERELVIRSLNSRHGWGSTKEERIEHAVFLVRRYGMHVDTVARAMVVSTTAITQRIRSEDERSRLARSGIDASRISQNSLLAISQIQSSELRDDVAKAVVELGANGEQAADIARSVRDARSKADASKKLADCRKSFAVAEKVKTAAGTGRLRKPRRDRFLRMLTQLSDFLDRGNNGEAFSTLDELTCSVEHDLDNVRMLSAKINGRLHCICEAGK